MEDQDDDAVVGYDDPTGKNAGESVDRRTYLKLAGVAVTSAAAAAAKSDVAAAASNGYGEDGYGYGGYGGSSGLTVSTADPSNVGATSMTLNGSIDDFGGASSADCYFEWRRSGASSWNATAKQTLSSLGSYSDSLSGLEDGVEYEYRAIAEASDGDVSDGNAVTVTTINDPAAVTTDSPSAITDSSATLNGSVDDLGNAASADCYLNWREVGTSSWTATTKQTLSSPGSFSVDVDSLSSSTDYEYKAIAEASDGDVSSGVVASFTTDSSSTAPSIDSYSVSESGSPNPHCEITADWSVSDADGDLDTVVLEVFDSSGSIVDTATTEVGGSRASGSDEVTVKHVDGQSFDVTLTVVDTWGDNASRTESVTE